MRCKIHWADCNWRHRFLLLPDLCKDIVFERNFLKIGGICAHVVLGGWTLGIPIVREKTSPCRMALAEDEPYCFWGLLADDGMDTPTGGSDVAGPREDSADALVKRQSESVLEAFHNIFMKTPGQTSLAQHRIDAGLSPLMRCKLCPVNAQKQAIMDACIKHLLSQRLIRRSRS